MKITKTVIPDVLLLEPKVFGDSRGFFFESHNDRRFQEETGVEVRFVQDNHSRSARGVLRGMHYQVEQPQGKLLRVIRGAIYDVAADLRRSSATFGRWVGVELSEENNLQMWVPMGFAHGFLVTSDTADVLYKTTDYYAPEHERCIAWDDPELAIGWPAGVVPSLSAKDAQGVSLKSASVFP